MCIRDGAICIGETKTCAQDEDTCIIITTETNDRKRVGNSVRSWGGGGAFRVADTTMLWEKPLSEEGARKRKGGKRIQWNDRNLCCQGFLKMRLQRHDGGGADIENFLGKKGLGKDTGEE